MKQKIFLTRTLHDFALKELKKKFEVDIHTGKIPIPQNTLKSKIKNLDGLICFPYDKINKEVENKPAIPPKKFTLLFDSLRMPYKMIPRYKKIK